MNLIINSIRREMTLVSSLLLFFLITSFPLISADTNGDYSDHHGMMDGFFGGMMGGLGMGYLLWVVMILIITALVLLIILLIRQLQQPKEAKNKKR